MNVIEYILSFLTCPTELNKSKIERQTAIDAKAAIDELFKQCKSALIKSKEENLKLQKEVEDLIRQLSVFEQVDLVSIIYQLGPKLAASMDPAGYGKPWWECLEALNNLFRVKNIEYVEWGPFQVFGQMQTAYPQIKLKSSFRDSSYRVLTKSDMVFAIVDSCYVRWMTYELNWRDCTGFGERFRSHLNIEYEINGCADVDGTLDGVPHNWNLVPTVEGLIMVDTLSMARCSKVPPGLVGYTPTEIITL